MTTTAANPFLEGQGVPVELRDIEAELARLWGPAAIEAGGEQNELAVTRLTLANLVIESLDDPARSALALDAVMGRHPCRAIVIGHAAEQARRIGAEVSALCRLPQPGAPQVCSERIFLRAGAAAVDLIPGAIRPLLEADLPLVLWWTSDPPRYPDLYRQLALESTRVVLDLSDPAPTAALQFGLDRSIHPYSRDAAWFAITGWRELVAQLFDPANLAHARDQISSVTVEVEASSPAHVPRPGLWLIAWLAGQLGWRLAGEPAIRKGTESSRLEAQFIGVQRLIETTIVARTTSASSSVPARVHSISLICTGPDGETRLTLARPGDQDSSIRIDVATPHACFLPRLIDSAEPDHPHRIIAAIESARVDPPFDRALPVALRLLAANER